MNITITKFQRNDQKQMNDFCNEIFSEMEVDTTDYKGLDDFHEYFKKPREILLLLKIGKKIIGSGGLLELTRKEAVLKRFYLSEEHRGKGLAQTLLEELVVFAKKMGYKYIIIDTHDNNIRAQNFFKKFGFRYFQPEPTKRLEDAKDPGMFTFMRLELH